MLIKHMLEASSTCANLRTVQMRSLRQLMSAASHFMKFTKPAYPMATCRPSHSGASSLRTSGLRRLRFLLAIVRFQSDQTQAPLKLVDFGLELKAGWLCYEHLDAATKCLFQVCLDEWAPDSGHSELLTPSEAEVFLEQHASKPSKH